MHVTVTRVSTADQPIERATIVAEEMYRWFEGLDGFHGFLMLSRPGTTLSITFWESGEVAERSRVSREEFRGRITAVAGVDIDEVADYEVMFGRLPAVEE